MKVYILFVQTDLDKAPRIYGAYKTWEECYNQEQEVRKFRSRIFDDDEFFEIWTDSVNVEG